jgi:hypothetical protein
MAGQRLRKFDPALSYGLPEADIATAFLDPLGAKA